MKISIYSIVILCLFTISTPMAFGGMGTEGAIFLFSVILIVPVAIGIGIWYGIKTRNKPIMILISVPPLIFLWILFLFIRG